MSPATSPAARGPDRDDRSDEAAPHFEVRDKRRIDPTTGELRQPPAGGGWSRGAGGHDVAPASPTRDGTAAAGSEELSAARAEAAERTADLQRLTAEYANYRKRVERDRQAAAEAGRAAVVAELLGILDDLDRAEAHGDLTGGFKNVAYKFVGVLERFGLERFGAEGDPFDPTLHEAMQFSTSPEVTEQTVTMVMRVGYLLGERVLRPAIVGVTGPEHGETDGADDAGAGTDADSDSDAAAAMGGTAGDTGEAGAAAAGADEDGGAGTNVID